MKKYYYNKLVRDKIPEIIKSRNGDCEMKIISSKKALTDLLKKKLVEESGEVLKAKKEDLVGELSDVLQIITSVAELENIKFGSIKKRMREKAKTNGVYKKGVFLVWSDKDKGHGDDLDKIRNKK